MGRYLRVSLALLASLATLVAAGCGSDASSGSGAGQGTSTTGTERGNFGPPRVLVALGGEPIEVGLLHLVDPAESTDATLSPKAGEHYVAVELRLHNTGAKAYEDSPANGATVVATTDATWEANIFDPVGPGFGSTTISPGDTRTGWITFAIPDGTVLKTLRFATDSGFGAQTTWSLR